ncbi:hypothetical protein D3C71_596650 [compost metagenome]
MQHFPAAAVIETCPGGDRPGVVELPVESAHAMGFERAPVIDRRFDRDALLDLAQIDEIGKILRKAEIAEHGGGDALIAADITLVMLHHRRGDVEVLRFRVGMDHRQGRIGLEAEFGAEARLDIAIVFERLVFVPDRPEMHVAGTICMPGIAIIEVTGGWARRPPDRLWHCLFHRPLDGVVEAIVGDEIAVAIIAGLLVPEKRADEFVIAAPEDDRGMGDQAFGLVLDLLFDIFEKIRRRGIDVAGELKILPDHKAEPVAGVVKLLVLVKTAAPDADHVHVGVDGGLQQVLRLLRAGEREERVGGNPVGASAKNFMTVDAEGKTAAGLVLVGQEFDDAQADLSGDRFARRVNDQGIERLFTAAGRPPEFGIFDMEDVGDAVFAWTHAAIETKAFFAELQMDRDDALAIGVEGYGDVEIDGAIIVMSLLGDDIFDAGDIQAFQGDFAVEAERCDREVPVPAEMALRLAQHIAIGDRAVFRKRQIERLSGLTLRACFYAGMEEDANDVFAGLDGLRDIWAVAAEAVVGRQNRHVVDEDDRHGIERGDVEIPGTVGVIDDEGSFDLPILMGDPLDVVFVAADIGVRDDADGFQRSVNVTGDGYGGGVGAVGGCEAPLAGERDDGHWCLPGRLPVAAASPPLACRPSPPKGGRSARFAELPQASSRCT